MSFLPFPSGEIPRGILLHDNFSVVNDAVVVQLPNSTITVNVAGTMVLGFWFAYSVTLNVSELASGVYFVKVDADKGTDMRKFVKK